MRYPVEVRLDVRIDYLSAAEVQKQRSFPPARFCCPRHRLYYDLLRLLYPAFLQTSVVALYLRLRGVLSRDG